jgi:hypothetical protein
VLPSPAADSSLEVDLPLALHVSETQATLCASVDPIITGSNSYVLPVAPSDPDGPIHLHLTLTGVSFRVQHRAWNKACANVANWAVMNNAAKVQLGLTEHAEMESMEVYHLTSSKLLHLAQGRGTQEDTILLSTRNSYSAPDVLTPVT